MSDIFLLKRPFGYEINGYDPIDITSISGFRLQRLWQHYYHQAAPKLHPVSSIFSHIASD